MEEELLAAAGLTKRACGVTFAVYFLLHCTQMLMLGGSRGISPVRPLLQQFRRDYSLPNAFFLHPSLFWISSSDLFIRFLPFVGTLCALVIVLGGCGAIFETLACLACYSIIVSWKNSLNEFFQFPWDVLIGEMSFLTLFLPPTNFFLTRGGIDISTTAAPSPLLLPAFCWLLFRLMFGFGKFKFLTGNAWAGENSLYIKHMLLWEPSPTRLGWYLYNYLPDMLFRAGLAALFLVEVPGPFLLFIGPRARALFACGNLALQLGITLSGTFGIFNLATALLSLPLLLSSPLVALPVFSAEFAAALAAHPVSSLLLAAHGVLSLPCLLFNSWCSHSWMYTIGIDSVRPLSPCLVRWLQRLAVLHTVGSYGVFPPEPQILRLNPVIEGSSDGTEWHEYHLKYGTDALDKPPLATPLFQDRFAFLLQYYPGNNLTRVGNRLVPHRCSTVHIVHRFCACLLLASPAVRRALGTDPFPNHPPSFVRSVQYVLRFSTPAERRATGQWFVRTSSSPEAPGAPPVWLPALHTADAAAQFALPDPLHFYPLLLSWKACAPALQPVVALLARHTAGAPGVGRAATATAPAVHHTAEHGGVAVQSVSAQPGRLQASVRVNPLSGPETESALLCELEALMVGHFGIPPPVLAAFWGLVQEEAWRRSVDWGHPLVRSKLQSSAQYGAYKKIYALLSFALMLRFDPWIVRFARRRLDFLLLLRQCSYDEDCVLQVIADVIFGGRRRVVEFLNNPTKLQRTILPSTPGLFRVFDE